MILVNRNFGNYALSQAIGDMFKSSSDEGMNIEWVNHTNALVAGSSLVTTLNNTAVLYTGGSTIGSKMVAQFNNYNLTCNNFYLVTEHFLKTLDKVYTKIWNESFTEAGIYVPANLATMYHGFVINGQLTSSNTDFMIFKKFVDRCITAGILDESDRLQYEDQIFLSGMSRANMSTQIDLDNKLITLTNSTPIDVSPDLNGLAGQYLAGKKLFLMVTPYLTNESIAKSLTYSFVSGSTVSPLVTQEPFGNVLFGMNFGSATGWAPWTTTLNTPVKRPIAFFKPKTDASKFGRSLPLATHLLWSIGTPADKEIALIEGTPVPDLVFDHLDRISHIDSLVLKIKFDKLQF